MIDEQKILLKKQLIEYLSDIVSKNPDTLKRVCAAIPEMIDSENPVDPLIKHLDFSDPVDYEVIMAIRNYLYKVYFGEMEAVK